MSTTTCNLQAPQLIDPVNQALLALADKGAMKPGLVKLAKNTSRACRLCGGNLLEESLEHYRDGTFPACPSCATAHAQLLRLAPEDGGAVFRRLLANMVAGIAQFGVNNGVVPAAPIIVTWELTARCNMGGCRHCHIAGGGADCLTEEITLARAREVAEELAQMGVASIAFTGGECLMWPGFMDLLRHATGLGLNCYLATNGLLLSREKAAKLKDAGLRLAHISLDGATAGTHDSFRRYPGSFEQVMRAVEHCREAGLQTAFSATPTKRNHREMAAILELADRLKVDWVITYNYIPAGRGGAELDLSSREKQSLWTELLEKSQSLNHTRWLSFAPQTAVMERALGQSRGLRPTHYYDPLLGSAQRMLASSPACMAGRFYLAIKADQRVIPCIFLPQEAGHLDRQNIKDIWRHSPVLSSLRSGKELAGLCAGCVYSKECGGCRARARASQGNYLATDPACPLAQGANVDLGLESAQTVATRG